MAFQKSENPKSEVVRLRVTPSERGKIVSAAKVAGMSVSAYILFKLGVSAGEALADAILESRGSSSDAPR